MMRLAAAFLAVAAVGSHGFAGAPALHPLASTPDTGTARGAYSTIRIGQRSDCALRGATTDAYVKEDHKRYPGTWGWMIHCRVGGNEGERNWALLYFDLSGVPRDASVQKATLHLSLVWQTARRLRDHHFGAFALRLPDRPGWTPSEVTKSQRKAGTPWPEGGVVAASPGPPVAIGRVVSGEVEFAGRRRKVDAAMEFDLTGIVRAWLGGKAPNCGIVLDNRLDGGAFDFHSSRAFEATLRPFLELTLSPAPGVEPKPLRVEVGPPPGDYWVEPMRRVHRRFKGKPGTLAQYGDSITVTMAFLAPFSWGPKIAPKNCPPHVQREMDKITAYADRKLWRAWKGAQWGNTGMMMSNWLLANVDTWQRKMQPEVAVVMFGTNDIGRIWPPAYTENMAAALRRMMADGTVPILTSIPPCHRPGHRAYWLAALSIAHGLEVPLIDYYAEVLRRRPDDWDGRLEKFSAYKGYQVPTLISRDGTHPSNPKDFMNDFSEEALNKNGYTLRNYLTLRKYYEVITKVLEAK